MNRRGFIRGVVTVGLVASILKGRMVGPEISDTWGYRPYITHMYVDSEAIGAGDGTSIEDAYTSLAAWEAAEQINLVAEGRSIVVHLSPGKPELGPVNIGDGWTTSRSKRIFIKGAT